MSRSFETTVKAQPGTFRHLVDQCFVIDGSATVELVEVATHGGSNPDCAVAEDRLGTPFSLLFQGEHDVPLSTGIHELKHGEGEAWMLSINPVQVTDRRQSVDQRVIYYESVFG